VNPLSALGQLRRKAGFSSQEDAAQALGCSKIHIAELERGSGGPSKTLLQRMAKLYRVPVKKLETVILKERKGLFKRSARKLGKGS